MQKTIQDYFMAEKAEALIFILVGMAACALAFWLWSQGHRLKAMAYPLVAIALIQFVVGGTVFLRTHQQIQDVTSHLQQSASSLKSKEVPRMETVMKAFMTYRYIEIALVALGLGLILFMRNSDTASAIGGGLILQAGIMLVLDLFAETRGEEYLRALRALT